MKCIRCNIEMLESTEKRIIRVNMIGHPTEDLQVINIGVKKPTLFSGKDEFKDVNLKWRGSSKQRVIDIQATIKNNNQVVLYEN